MQSTRTIQYCDTDANEDIFLHDTEYMFSFFCEELYFICLLISLYNIFQRKFKFYITCRDTTAENMYVKQKHILQ